MNWLFEPVETTRLMYMFVMLAFGFIGFFACLFMCDANEKKNKREIYIAKHIKHADTVSGDWYKESE